MPDGDYYVEDVGNGIDGTPKEIARLFRSRAMISTKLLRLPTRGALGNDPRVPPASLMSYSAMIDDQSLAPALLRYAGGAVVSSEELSSFSAGFLAIGILSYRFFLVLAKSDCGTAPRQEKLKFRSIRRGFRLQHRR
jgi:hypothetical protein